MVFNEKWVNYPVTVAYRSKGASEVAKLGGLASLIRSVTPFSIYSPHAGQQSYEKGDSFTLYILHLMPFLITYILFNSYSSRTRRI